MSPNEPIGKWYGGQVSRLVDRKKSEPCYSKSCDSCFFFLLNTFKIEILTQQR